jgi:hypothetical protein
MNHLVAAIKEETAHWLDFFWWMNPFNYD